MAAFAALATKVTAVGLLIEVFGSSLMVKSLIIHDIK